MIVFELCNSYTVQILNCVRLNYKQKKNSELRFQPILRFRSNPLQNTLDIINLAGFVITVGHFLKYLEKDMK